jgi:uncharacterized protein (UPF0262 family)
MGRVPPPPTDKSLLVLFFRKEHLAFTFASSPFGRTQTVPDGKITAHTAHAAPAEPGATRSLLRVELGGETGSSLSALQQADLAQAVRDLAVANRFEPKNLQGPFVLRLSIVEGRLVFDVRDENDAPRTALGLALGPFRRLIKDYQMLVDSYAHAVQDGREASIQAIDMGRRGLHNEGATLMVERLAGRVEIDFETARRLFTVVCVLHTRI